MRLLTSTAVLSCACAAVLSGGVAGAPVAKPRLVSNRPVETGARWIGVVSASRRPVVTARLGRRAQAVTVRRAPPRPLPAARDLPPGWPLDALGRSPAVRHRARPAGRAPADECDGRRRRAERIPAGLGLLGPGLSLGRRPTDSRRRQRPAGALGRQRPRRPGCDRLPGRDRSRSAGRLRDRPRRALGTPRRSVRDDHHRRGVPAADGARVRLRGESLGLRAARRREAPRRGDRRDHDLLGLQPPARPGRRRPTARCTSPTRSTTASSGSPPAASISDPRRRHQPAERRRARPGREHLLHRVGEQPDPAHHAGRRR